MTQRAMFSDEEPGRSKAVPTLTLLSATYRNFKGLSTSVLETGGGNVSVFGKNASGKTRLEDGILWLLSGKDSAGKADFVVKPLDEFNQPIHNLDSVVEATFLWMGRSVTLKRVFTETWTQKRGSTEKTLTGHTTTYYVDGVTRTEAQYKAFIASIVDEKVFRLLTDPRYFNEQLHWEERRRILLEVCGDVSDEDVIASNPALSELRSILGNRSLDDHRKMLKEEKSKVDKAVKQIPGKISEVQLGIAGVSGIDPKQLSEDIRTARAERQAKAQELAGAESGGAVAGKQKRISEISAELLDLDIQARAKADKAIRLKKDALNDVRDKTTAAERDLRGTAGDLAEAERQLPKLAQRKKDLVAQWEAVDAEQFAHSEEEPASCPTCGQDLPEEMVAEARQKALEAFNLSKAERLEKNEADGAEVHEQSVTVEADVKRCKEASALLEKRITALKAQAVPMQAEIDKTQVPQARPVTVTTTQEYVQLADERDTLQKSIEDIRAGNQTATAAIRSELAAMDLNIAALERKAAQVEQAEGARKRIAELQAEEKKLSAEYERMERESNLTDEFVKTKVLMLSEKINDRFAFATFKMFNNLVNGGIEDCCETLYEGVPYLTNLNTGARINIGLDLIEVFSQHYGFRAPVFIDNAESVTYFIPISAQVIKLIASPEDEVLRIKKEAVQ